MLKNYLFMAMRNLKREKLSSLLNITGLAIGMGTALLIMLWVNDETSYDRFNTHYHNIYRLVGRFELNGEKHEQPMAPPAMAGVMLREFPGVVMTCRFREYGGAVIKTNNRVFSEDNIIYTDSTLTQLFSISTIAGDAVKALAEPNSLVITREASLRYFGTENTVGRQLTVDNETMVIGAVIEDLPANSHFRQQVFASLEGKEESHSKNFLSTNFFTYILLSPDVSPEEINNRFPGFIIKYMGPDIERLIGKTLSEFMKSASATYELQPLSDIHLKSDFKSELGANGNITQVWFFGFIAIFILIIACINFMNMATAKAERRAREVGIRKTSGALAWQIAAQYMTESALIAVISHVVAMLLVELALPWFNLLAGKQIELHYLSPVTLVGLLSVVVTSTLLAGSYPAFYLSGLKPIVVLKGGFGAMRGRGTLRNILVVVQFMTTIVLISGTIIIYLQLSYINNKDVGYSKENLVMLYNAGYLGNKTEIFRHEMLQHDEIIAGSVSSFLPVPSSRNGSAVFPDDNRDATVSLQQWQIDYNYLETMNIQLAEGRNFSKEYGTDSMAVIVNEAAVKQFGWGDPLNHSVSNYIWNGSDIESAVEKLKVIGVVKNFNYESLHEQIRPMILFLSRGQGWIITFRIKPGQSQKVLALLEKHWKSYVPGEPFEYGFVDQRFNAVYKREQRMGKIVSAFSVLAIVLATIGLFGLAAYSTERRTKEIGIRKVNGASTRSIMMLLAKDFSRLIIIAFMVAVPPAWYVLHLWLEQFAYHVEIKIWMFIIAGLTAYFIAMFTTLYHSYSVACKNPVDALKYE